MDGSMFRWAIAAATLVIGTPGSTHAQTESVDRVGQAASAGADERSGVGERLGPAGPSVGGSRSSAETLAPPVIAEAGSPIERYGEAPVDRTPQFLRQVTPLLRSGQCQFDYGMVYALQETNFPALEGSNLVRTDVRRRAWFTPLAVRYGWTDRVQLFLNLPIGWSDTELANPLTDESRSVGGLGDATFGMTALLRRDPSSGRSTIGTVRAVAPTGEALNPLVLESSGLGNGVWRRGADLLWVQPLDPVILFYGLGYTYSFESRFGDTNVRLGQQFSYNFGLGFAANERVTLSTAVLGAYLDETETDGQNLAGTDIEPIRVRLAATIAERRRLVEPFVTFGLTDTAPSVELGVIWTR